MKSPEAQALELVARGAILKTLHPTSRHFLVGDLRWLASNAIFWFTAHGDCADDGHLLTFDQAMPVRDGSMVFQARERPIAVLSTIDGADVTDADDYRIAFTFWRETGPIVRPLIDRSFDRYASEAEPQPVVRPRAGFTAVVA